MDESKDSKGKYILKILGMPLDGTDKSIYLIKLLELEKTNSQNILTEILYLIPELITKKRILIVLKTSLVTGQHIVSNYEKF